MCEIGGRTERRSAYRNRGESLMHSSNSTVILPVQPAARFSGGSASPAGSRGRAGEAPAPRSRRTHDAAAAAAVRRAGLTPAQRGDRPLVEAEGQGRCAARLRVSFSGSVTS